jgi:hypothetical protein
MATKSAAKSKKPASSRPTVAPEGVEADKAPDGSSQGEANALSATVAKLRIEYWPVGRLNPYEKNPRKNDAAVDRMTASIKEFGFSIPILARSKTGLICDGHLRYKAAVKLGMAEVPVIPCDGWTDAQFKAFRLMANRSVNWAEFDPDLLAMEFLDLQTMDFDLSMTGFDALEISGYLNSAVAGLTDEDAVPEVPKVPVSRTGDLWILGPRAICPHCGTDNDA